MSAVKYIFFIIIGSNVIPSSEHFDIRLMIVLLRNLVQFDIFDDLPYETVTTKGADLSRIKYYRNKLINIDATGELISKSEFEKMWTNLSLVSVKSHMKLSIKKVMHQIFIQPQKKIFWGRILVSLHCHHRHRRQTVSG